MNLPGGMELIREDCSSCSIVPDENICGRFGFESENSWEKTQKRIDAKFKWLKISGGECSIERECGTDDRSSCPLGSRLLVKGGLISAPAVQAEPPLSMRRGVSYSLSSMCPFIDSERHSQSCSRRSILFPAEAWRSLNSDRSHSASQFVETLMDASPFTVFSL